MTARTDTVLLPRITGDLADTTRAIEFPWLRPAVTATYRRPPGRLTHTWRRLRASTFAADVRTGVRRGLTVMGVVAVLIGLVVTLRGAVVAAELFGLFR